MAPMSEPATSEAAIPCKDQRAQHPDDFESVDAPVLSDEEAQSLIDASNDRHGWYRNHRLTKYSFDRLYKDPNSSAKHCFWSIHNTSGEPINWDGTFDIVNGKIHFRNSFKAFLSKHILPLDAMTQHLLPRLNEWGLLTVRRALRRTVNAYFEKRLAVSADCEEDLVSIATWLLEEEPDLDSCELFWCSVNLLGMRYGSVVRKTRQLLFDARTMIARHVDREFERRNKLPHRDTEMRFNEWRAKLAVEIYAKHTSFGSLDCIVDVVEDADVILVSKLHQITLEGAQARELLCESEERMRPGIDTPWKQMCWIYKDYDRFRYNHGYAVRRLKRNALSLNNATAKTASGDRGMPSIQSPTIRETSVSVSKPIRKQQKKGGSKRSKKNKRARKHKRAKKVTPATYEETIHVDQGSTQDGQPTASKGSLAGDDELDEADESTTTADWNGAGSNPYAVLLAESSSSATVITTNRHDARSNSVNVSSQCSLDSEGWQAVQGRKAQRPKKCKVVEDTSEAKKHEVAPDPPCKPLPQRVVPKTKVTEEARRSLLPTPVAPWANFSMVSITSQRKTTVKDLADARLDAAISRSKELHTRAGSGPTNAPSQGLHFDSGDFPRTSQGSLPGRVEEMGTEKSNNTIAVASCSKAMVAPRGMTLPPAEFGSPLTFPLALELSDSPYCATDSVYSGSAVDLTSVYDSGELKRVNSDGNKFTRKDCISDFTLSLREEENAAAVGDADMDDWETIGSSIDNEDEDGWETIGSSVDNEDEDGWETTNSTVDTEHVDAYAPYAEDANSRDTNDFHPVHHHSEMSHVVAWLGDKYTLAHAGLGEAEIQASRW
jgi:DNA-binding protein H-NS